MCAKNGITELSNYVLYNSEDFGGKGKKYHADTPENLYERMRITLDLKDEINSELPDDCEKVAAFSFPMRYIPLSAHERGYVGSMWNAKYLRAVQRMLVPTQGKGVCSRSFFEADFGKSADEFVRYLGMPERLIASRGKISTTSRGKSKETEEEFEVRKAGWERDQKKIDTWNSLYDQLGDEKESFVALIGDNEYLPEKVLGITSSLQRKMYLLYLTTPRLFSLLGLIDKKSPTYDLVYDFITIECPQLYMDLLDLLTERESQQNYIFTNFIKFFGKKGIHDLMAKLEKFDFAVDKQLAKWDVICKKSGVEYIDYELIRVYRRYIDLEVLNDNKHEQAKKSIKELKMVDLAQILYGSVDDFEQKLLSAIDSEQGQKLLSKVTKSIYNNIQLKLSKLLEEV